MPFSEAAEKLLDALAVIAVHGHGHYVTDDQRDMLAEARSLLTNHVKWLEARRFDAEEPNR